MNTTFGDMKFNDVGWGLPPEIKISSGNIKKRKAQKKKRRGKNEFHSKDVSKFRRKMGEK